MIFLTLALATVCVSIAGLSPGFTSSSTTSVLFKNNKLKGVYLRNLNIFKNVWRYPSPPCRCRPCPRAKRKSKEKKQRDVLHVPVHLLLVGVDPVQGRIQKETQRENKKDKWWRCPLCTCPPPAGWCQPCPRSERGRDRERNLERKMMMSFMYLSTSCWSVSTLSKGRYRKRQREKVRKTNDEDVLHVPVHFLLVGVNPV